MCLSNGSCGVCVWDPNAVVVDDHNLRAKNENYVLVLFDVTIYHAEYLHPRSNTFTLVHPHIYIFAYKPGLCAFVFGT